MWSEADEPRGGRRDPLVPSSVKRHGIGDVVQEGDETRCVECGAVVALNHRGRPRCYCSSRCRTRAGRRRGRGGAATVFWEGPGARLHLGDARPVLAQLPAGSVQCVVTSVPYWRMRDWGDGPGVIGMEDDVPAHVDALVEMMDAVRRVLRPDGTAWLNVADSYSMRAQGARQAPGRGHRAAALPARPSTTGVARAESLLGIPQRLELALVERGWLLRSEIVWRKPNAMPEVVADRPRRCTERILLLTRSERYVCACEPGTTDVWDIPTTPSPVRHPAGFPLALPATCIQAATRPGEVVLDPFCGGGTTGVAALEAGRQFVGVDTSEACLEGARERLETLRRETA